MKPTIMLSTLAELQALNTVGHEGAGAHPRSLFVLWELH
jgi:hypothetical protein